MKSLLIFNNNFFIFKGLIFLLIILLTLVVYWPGLRGPFLLDDFANLDALGKFGGVRNWETFKLYLLGNTSGPSGRFLSLLSFLINDNNWPSDPFSFKYTNLLLHLLTGVLLAWLIYRLMLSLAAERREQRAALVALLTAALWLLHPFQVSTTLYIVQRMAILSALFSIMGLLIYVHGRSLLASQPRQAYCWMTLSVILCAPLAFFSKENGALLPLLILVMEYTASRHSNSQQPASRWVFIFLGLPTILLFGYFLIHWNGVLEGYKTRPFTLTERLLTESRIVSQYLNHLLIPNLGNSGIFNENPALSHGLLDPPTTLIAVLFIIISILGAWWARVRYPLLSLAILFFFSGHLLESTFIPLELYFEHRNYLPSIFLFLPVTNWLITKTEERKEIVFIPLLMISLFSFLTHQQAILWSDHQKLAVSWAQNNPYSIRAQRTFASEMESFNQPGLALNHLEKTIRLFPDHLELWLHRIILVCHYLRPSPDEFSRLLNISKTGFYDFRTYPLLESFINDIIANRCPGISSTYAHQFLDMLLLNKTAQIHNGPKRQIHHLHGLVYLKENQAGLALDSFAKSQQILPDVEAGLLQVSLLANQRMFAEALELLEIIEKNLDNNVKALSKDKKTDFMHEIIRLKKSLFEDLDNMGASKT